MRKREREWLRGSEGGESNVTKVYGGRRYGVLNNLLFYDNKLKQNKKKKFK